MLRSSHDACGCSTQTTSTINLKRSTLHPHEGQADRPNTPSDSVNLGSNPGPPASIFNYFVELPFRLGTPWRRAAPRSFSCCTSALLKIPKSFRAYFFNLIL